jgi:hypothetical protein
VRAGLIPSGCSRAQCYPTRRGRLEPVRVYVLDTENLTESEYWLSGTLPKCAANRTDLQDSLLTGAHENGTEDCQKEHIGS